MANKIIATVTEKFLIPFRLVPKEGLSPEKLAFSMTVGIVCGIFPVIGATTVLSLLLTLLFRQNLLVVQSVQWLMALFQVALIIPFMKFGVFMLNRRAIHISIEQINLAFQPGFAEGIKTIGIFHLYGIFTWVLLALPLGALSYFILVTVFRKKSPSEDISLLTPKF